MKRTFAAVAVVLFVVLVVAIVFVGPQRYVVRSVVLPDVGAVRLDSGVTVAELTATEDLRIDGDVELFDQIGEVAVAPNGTIVVPQFKQRHYRFYAADGARIATLGRDGAGPGEFRVALSHFGWNGDTLWVWDPELSRLTFATSAGRYIGDESLNYAFAAPRDWGRFPPMVGIAGVVGVRGNERLVTTRTWKSLPSLRHSRGPVVAIGDMHVINRIVGDFPYGSDSDYVTVDIGSRHLAEMTHPLRALARGTAAFDGGRIAYLVTVVDGEHGGRLRLTVLAASGDTLVAREYGFVGEARPARVADSIVEARLSQETQTPRRQDGLRQLLDRSRRQPVYPPVSSLVMGRDSTTWIGFRSTTDTRAWLVLDAQGAPVGSLRLPTRFRISDAERATVWGVARDDDDVESVVRYRVSGW